MTTSLRTPIHPRRYRTPSRLAVHVAPQLGMRPASVEQMVFGHSPIHHRFAVLVHGARALGDTEMEIRLMAPLRQAIADVGRIELDAGVFRTVRAADSSDDQSQIIYVLEPTDENAKRLVSDIDRTIARMLELRAAVVAKHRLENQS